MEKATHDMGLPLGVQGPMCSVGAYGKSFSVYAYPEPCRSVCSCGWVLF